jgi:hypothetical protein
MHSCGACKPSTAWLGVHVIVVVRGGGRRGWAAKDNTARALLLTLNGVAHILCPLHTHRTVLVLPVRRAARVWTFRTSDCKKNPEFDYAPAHGRDVAPLIKDSGNCFFFCK